ncbi:MAG: N-6 DNA methylase [Bacteroidetes bacterium]|jgi:type I restriction enzyme M protein|nr:N-6 DNA methylase [Bacteroidota bacterium]
MSEQPSLFGRKLRADIEIENELWEAAVDLRGNIAPADYKHYVLPLLFLRYLSLRYNERRDELESLVKDPESAYYTEDQAIQEDILADPDEYKRKGAFIIPEEARWSYLRDHAQDDDIKLKVDHAMELLEDTYPELQGVLPKIYAGSNLSRENLTNLINLFSRDIFQGETRDKQADILGRVYEYFITHFASTEGTRGGEFFTPRSIVQVLVAMLEPTSGTVFDPACGSGGMFVQAAAFTDNRHALSFYGQESIDTTLRLCKMNLLMHGLQGDVRLGNSLLNDQHEGVKADYVIANPPFNIRSWGADKIPGDDPRLQIGRRRVQPTDSNANYMWMMHFLHHLKDGGTAGYVMSNGSMTTSLTHEEEARTALVDEGFVDCIVQLPSQLFFGTGIPACLWFLSKGRDGSDGQRKRDDEILFIDARELGEMATRTQRVLSDDEVAELEQIYHRFRTDEAPEDEPGFYAVASLDQVRGNDYKLTPGLYVGFADDEDDGVPFEIKMPQLIDELEDQFAESERLQKKISSELKQLI